MHGRTGVDEPGGTVTVTVAPGGQVLGRSVGLTSVPVPQLVSVQVFRPGMGLALAKSPRPEAAIRAERMNPMIASLFVENGRLFQL